MKTFKDLKFKPYNNGIVGKTDIHTNNGTYEISVAMSPDTYGGNSGLWEIAVFREEEGYTDQTIKCLKGGGVEGWLTFSELEKKIIEIQNELKGNENERYF